MGENETSSSVQEMNIQEVKDFIAKEFQLEIAEKFEGKLVSHCVFSRHFTLRMMVRFFFQITYQYLKKGLKLFNSALGSLLCTLN